MIVSFICSILLGCMGFLNATNGDTLRNQFYLLNETCGPEEFPCSDGKCLSRELVCDLRNDCNDGSDEKYCQVKTGVADISSKSGEEACFMFSVGDTERQEIYSPNYPNNYPDNIDCKVRITADEGFRVELKFQEFFELENDQDCHFDKVEIRDGPSENDPLVRSICGMEIPRSLTSPNRYIWLRFKSDGSNSGRGFKARYEFRPKSNQSVSASCPLHIPFPCSSFKVLNQSRCIPTNWICNGYNDCSEGEDEVNCGNPSTSRKIAFARFKAMNWLRSRRQNDKQFRKWGPDVTRIATALFLGDVSRGFNNYNHLPELTYEIGMNIHSRLTSIKEYQGSSSELAFLVHALLVTCANPRDFFGRDLVEELRQRVFESNFTHPFVMLALCNAGERITRGDADGLTKVFWKAAQEHWTDTQALTVLAMSCAAEQANSVVDLQELEDFTLELKNRQYRNGSVENLKTTALVMQAILSSDHDADNFDEERALRRIIEAQSDDGSFGNLVNTYYVLPVLAGRSLANISAKHCNYLKKDEQEAYQDFGLLNGKDWRVYYSLWLGDNRTVEKTLSLKVPKNTTFYRVMEYAADLDSIYRFEYTIKNGKPYPYSISGVQDDPEQQLYWNLFTVSEADGESLDVISKSPTQVIPENEQHLVYWYKRRMWNPNSL